MTKSKEISFIGLLAVIDPCSMWRSVWRMPFAHFTQLVMSWHIMLQENHSLTRAKVWSLHWWLYPLLISCKTWVLYSAGETSWLCVDPSCWYIQWTTSFYNTNLSNWCRYFLIFLDLIFQIWDSFNFLHTLYTASPSLCCYPVLGLPSSWLEWLCLVLLPCYYAAQITFYRALHSNYFVFAPYTWLGS